MLADATLESGTRGQTATASASVIDCSSQLAGNDTCWVARKREDGMICK